jgi:hypothetical protein
MNLKISPKWQKARPESGLTKLFALEFYSKKTLACSKTSGFLQFLAFGAISPTPFVGHSETVHSGLDAWDWNKSDLASRATVRQLRRICFVRQFPCGGRALESRS